MDRGQIVVLIILGAATTWHALAYGGVTGRIVYMMVI
jgi:hypothetical protein